MSEEEYPVTRLYPICDDCINKKGEMCHTPGCIFIRNTMEELKYLNFSMPKHIGTYEELMSYGTISQHQKDRELLEKYIDIKSKDINDQLAITKVNIKNTHPQFDCAVMADLQCQKSKQDGQLEILTEIKKHLQSSDEVEGGEG